MDDGQTHANNDESLGNWQGHTKNIKPSAAFESVVKAAALPAKQQADRAAEITRQNIASAQLEPKDAPAQPAMPTGTANSVYPDSDRGVISSQSQTPRFQFDTDIDPDSEIEGPVRKSFFKRIFGR